MNPTTRSPSAALAPNSSAQLQPPKQQDDDLLEDPSGLINAAMPWAISLLFHVMIFLLMFLIVWVVQVTGTDEPLPISEAGLADYFDEQMSTGFESPDLQLTQDQFVAETDQVADLQLNLLSEVSSAANEISIIGIGAGASGGDLAKYGLSAAGLGEGPSFFGLGRGEINARNICYVVDRSGSMVDELNFVKDEVIRSVDRLHRVQQFHIIFFSGGVPVEPPPQRFVHAIKENKKRAFEFLDSIQAGGSTDPAPALARAIQLGADLIYFLTDGEFDPKVVEQLRKLNRRNQARVYTIAFLRRKGEDLLRQIARENGGEFRFVSEDDLH